MSNSITARAHGITGAIIASGIIFVATTLVETYMITTLPVQ